MAFEDKPDEALISIQLRQQSEDDSPFIGKELVADLRAALKNLLTDLGSSGRGWVRGKSEQELAKARQILSEAIDRIGQLQLAADAQKHKQKIEAEEANARIESMRADTRLQILERVVKIAKDLNELGVKIDIQVMLAEIGVSAGNTVPRSQLG